MNTPHAGKPESLFKPAVIFLFLWILFFYKFIILGHVLSGGDLVNHYIPYKQFFKDCINKGIFPLWNPHTFSGRPFQADIQAGVFYPPNWFCLIMPVPVFFTLSTIIHLWFTSIGSFIFSGLFLKKTWSRYFFTLCFSFSAFFVTRLYSGIVLFIFTASYIPWILYAAERWRIKRTPGATVLLGILLTLQLLSGSPQVAFYTWIALFFLFIIQLRGSKSEVPLWRGYAVAALIMLGLSAVQFIPTKEYIDHSYERARGANWEYITDGSLEAKSLVSFLAPDFFSPPRREDIFWSSSLGFWEYNGYLGIAPIVFILVFLFSGGIWKMFPRSADDGSRRRIMLLSLIFFLFWAFLAFGKNSWIFWVFFRFVPGFDRFRVPARLVIYYILALSFFSSVAFEYFMDTILEKDRDRKWQTRIVISVLAVFALGFLSSLVFLLKPITVLKWFGIEKFIRMDLIKNPNLPFHDILFYSRKSVFVSLGFLFINCMIIVIFTVIKKTRAWKAYLIVGILLIDLFLFGLSYPETVPYREFYERYYPETEVSELLKTTIESHQRIAWTDDVFWWQYDQNQIELYPNRGIIKGLYDTRGYDPVFLRRYGEFFNAIGRFPEDRSPGGLLRMEHIDNPNLLSLLNVRYILTYTQLEIPGWEKAWSFSFGLHVYENKNVPGNAFLARYYPVPESHKSEIPKVLMQPRVPLLELALSGDDNPYSDPKKEKVKGEESVRLTFYSPNRREYDVVTAHSDTLVFSEVYYPGWKIYVNGERVPSHVVDHALLGAFLPPGSHHVVCKFFPYSLMIGGFVSGITMLTLLGWFVLKRRRKE